MKESDLYLPLKQFLETQGYEVKGEVHDCDVLAIRDNEPPVIVELKLSLNLTVILQAVERLVLTPEVYIGVPNRCGALKRQRRRITKLLRMLGLGLVTIDSNRAAEGVKVLFDPGVYTPRKSKSRQVRLLGEFEKRVGDPNLGGSDTKKGIMTAYRQRSLKIASFLDDNGPTKASQIALATSLPNARDILYKDFYGWFDRVATGIYQLSPRGIQETSLSEETDSNLSI